MRRGVCPSVRTYVKSHGCKVTWCVWQWCVQLKTALARSLPCFNPIGAFLSCRFWRAPTGKKYRFITNYSNFGENISQQKHALYSLQLIIAHNKYLFDNSGNIRSIKLSQQKIKQTFVTTSHNVTYQQRVGAKIMIVPRNEIAPARAIMSSYACYRAHPEMGATRRMAIANGTCVSFCNQPKAHFCLPWIRPWNNRGKCHTDEKRIQCLSNAS